MKKMLFVFMSLVGCTQSEVVEFCTVQNNVATCSQKTSELRHRPIPHCDEPVCEIEYFDYADGAQYRYHVQVVETCSDGEVNVWVEVHCPEDLVLRNGTCVPC